MFPRLKEVTLSHFQEILPVMGTSRFKVLAITK